MQLSIITPYYDTLELTLELAKVLEPQLDDTIEWIIIDDGCNENELDKLNAKVIHLPTNSGNASHPRNVGLNIAIGEYITFIDSDDLISEDYIYHIRQRMRLNPDIIFLSWKMQNHEVLMTTKPPNWNCSVWCRVYKKSIIGNTRFDRNLTKAEDWKFNQQIKYYSSKCVRKYIYFYNSGRKGSLTNG